MMKNSLILLFMLLLGACQQAKVYVFTSNLPTQQQQQLTAALERQSLPYEFVTHDIPKEFGAATILLSSDKILREETQQLADIMQLLGYRPEINYTTRANHFYEHGNIGFYLKGPEPQASFKMPKRLVTTGCDEDQFNDLVVRFTAQQVNFVLASGAEVTLPWEYLYGYLVIYYKNYSQTYTHSQPLINTPFGSKPSDTYTFTARVNKPGWLNCSLQVVYMD